MTTVLHQHPTCEKSIKQESTKKDMAVQQRATTKLKTEENVKAVYVDKQADIFVTWKSQHCLYYYYYYLRKEFTKLEEEDSSYS